MMQCKKIRISLIVFGVIVFIFKGMFAAYESNLIIPVSNHGLGFSLSAISIILIIVGVFGFRNKPKSQEIDELKTRIKNLEDEKIESRIKNERLEEPTKTQKEQEGFNDNFAFKQFDFNDGLESVIEITYGVPRESKVKLFFTKDDFSTFSRNYTEKLKDNFIRLTIAPSSRANASLISGGNYDFNDSFDKGYSLFVSMRREDSKLMKVVSDVLRSENFGCLPTRFTISAHKNDDFPLEHKAVEILTKLNEKLTKAVQDMK